MRCTNCNNEVKASQTYPELWFCHSCKSEGSINSNDIISSLKKNSLFYNRIFKNSKILCIYVKDKDIDTLTKEFSFNENQLFLEKDNNFDSFRNYKKYDFILLFPKVREEIRDVLDDMNCQIVDLINT